MHNAAKDNEMVAMKNSWIYDAIFDNRKGRVNSSAELETYKDEFDRYYLWVMIFEILFLSSKRIMTMLFSKL